MIRLGANIDELQLLLGKLLYQFYVDSVRCQYVEKKSLQVKFESSIIDFLFICKVTEKIL